ncbi:hypothetical protein [Vibrio cholerae]|uniref:hypothetical protein n=1 Tax=Vibrio cholerae TaxID=666 RepID=UPI001C2F85A2
MKQDRYNREVKAIIISPPTTKFQIFLENFESPLDIKLPLSRYSKEGDKLECGGVLYQIVQKIKVDTFNYKVVVKEFTL